MTKAIPTAQLNDCLEDAAMQALVSLLAGCDDVNAPPASYLWQLLAILAREGAAVQRQLQALQ